MRYIRDIGANSGEDLATARVFFRIYIQTRVVYRLVLGTVVKVKCGLGIQISSSSKVVPSLEAVQLMFRQVRRYSGSKGQWFRSSGSEVVFSKQQFRSNGSEVVKKGSVVFRGGLGSIQRACSARSYRNLLGSYACTPKLYQLQQTLSRTSRR